MSRHSTSCKQPAELREDYEIESLHKNDEVFADDTFELVDRKSDDFEDDGGSEDEIFPDLNLNTVQGLLFKCRKRLRDDEGRSQRGQKKQKRAHSSTGLANESLD